MPGHHLVAGTKYSIVQVRNPMANRLGIGPVLKAVRADTRKMRKMNI